MSAGTRIEWTGNIEVHHDVHTTLTGTAVSCA